MNLTAPNLFQLVIDPMLIQRAVDLGHRHFAAALSEINRRQRWAAPDGRPESPEQIARRQAWRSSRRSMASAHPFAGRQSPAQGGFFGPAAISQSPISAPGQSLSGLSGIPR